jgi:hypothetical protein
MGVGGDKKYDSLSTESEGEVNETSPKTEEVKEDEQKEAEKPADTAASQDGEPEPERHVGESQR